MIRPHVNLWSVTTGASQVFTFTPHNQMTGATYTLAAAKNDTWCPDETMLSYSISADIRQRALLKSARDVANMIWLSSFDRIMQWYQLGSSKISSNDTWWQLPVFCKDFWGAYMAPFFIANGLLCVGKSFLPEFLSFTMSSDFSCTVAQEIIACIMLFPE